MFDAKLFSEILQKISNSYSSITDFANKSEVNRTYLSKYINMKLTNPPTPKILVKIANASHGITTYNELMTTCGYTDSDLNVALFLNSRDEIRDQYLKNLASIQLTSDEKDVFNSLQDIISKEHRATKNLDDILKIIPTYFEDINWLDKKSIEKISKKLTLYFQYSYKIDELYDTMVEEKKDYDQNIAWISPNISFYMCPIYGKISAGQPNWTEECIEGRLPIDPDLMGIVNPEEHYFLRVNGDSMNKVVKNGAFALIHKQDYVDNGEIAVVLVNGDNATLKRFSKQGDIIVLTPESNDDSFKQQIYTKDTPIRVIGKYIGKMEINK